MDAETERPTHAVAISIAPEDQFEIEEVNGFVDGLRRGAIGAITSVVGGVLTKEILHEMEPPHLEINRCRLVQDLKGESPHPLSVKLFSQANLAAFLGAERAIIESPLLTANPPAKLQHFREYVAETIERLVRDLAVPVKSTSSGLSAEGWKQEAISKVKPLEGMPPITTLADVQAYEFILIGANTGARFQGERQARHFGLNGELNGGAEFLFRFTSIVQAAKAMGGVFRDTKQFSGTPEAEQVKETSMELMRGLAQAFKDASSNMPWLDRS